MGSYLKVLYCSCLVVDMSGEIGDHLEYLLVITLYVAGAIYY